MNIEKFVLDFLEGVSTLNFNTISRYLGISLLVFWVVVVWWVWSDARERSSNVFFAIFSALLVLILNILGLVIYLIIRPKTTADEDYWSELERRYLKYETADLEDCPNCGLQLQPGFVFCPECKEEVKIKCPSCEVLIDKNWKNCAFCGEANGAFVASKTVVKSAEGIGIWDTFLVGLREWGKLIDDFVSPKVKKVARSRAAKSNSKPKVVKRSNKSAKKKSKKKSKK